MTEGGLDDTKIDILVNQLRCVGMPAGVGAEILHSTFLQEGFILVVECVVAHRFSDVLAILGMVFCTVSDRAIVRVFRDFVHSLISQPPASDLA